MIKETLKIFSQNIRKNKTLMNTILENNKNNMDIILVQEPSKSFIRHVPSHTDPIGDPIYGTPNHPDWTLFIRQDPAQENYHKWSLTICDGCFDTLKSSKMRS